MKLWDKKVFKYAVVSSVVWSLIHLYAFVNLMVSHDSLAEFYAGAELYRGYTGMTWKISLGRFVIPVYQKLFRGTVAAPWLIGLLAMVYFSLAVYVVAKMFEQKKAFSVFLIAGILITNPSVFLTIATYIHDFDVNMLALLLSVTAAWCWKEKKPVLWVAGSVCISLCMGIYACYLSVAVVLIMIYSILDLMNENKPVIVVSQGLKGIAMILAGGGIYVLMTALVCKMTGVALLEGEYNSITNIVAQNKRNDLLNRIVLAYQDVVNVWSRDMFGQGDSMNWISICMLIVGLAVMVVRIIRRRIGFISCLLICMLLVLLPVAMDLSLIAGDGIAHDLMKCAFVLVYFLVLLIAEPMIYATHKMSRFVGVLLAACICVICWQYTVQANQIYVKKDLDNRFTSSLMTRIMTRVEQNEDYVQYETKLLFVGDIDYQINHRRELREYEKYTGMWGNTPIKTWRLYERYLEYMMGIEVAYCNEKESAKLLKDPRVMEMAIYPQEGSIKKIDDTLVIRIGP